MKNATNIEKDAFRRLERVHIKEIKSHQTFNETCIYNKMLPTYTYIHSYILDNESINSIYRIIQRATLHCDRKNAYRVLQTQSFIL